MLKYWYIHECWWHANELNLDWREEIRNINEMLSKIKILFTLNTTHWGSLLRIQRISLALFSCFSATAGWERVKKAIGLCNRIWSLVDLLNGRWDMSISRESENSFPMTNVLNTAMVCCFCLFNASHACPCVWVVESMVHIIKIKIYIHVWSRQRICTSIYAWNALLLFYISIIKGESDFDV